jgi:tyrosyl-tRNA synthetase
MTKQERQERTRELLTRGNPEIIVGRDLERKLLAGKPLRVKHGVDPTTKDLHLGYAVVYEKLRQFQELGHTVIFLIGGFTGRFGDPREAGTRNLRRKLEVKALAKDYLKQLGKILDIKKVEVRDNSEWYDKMTLEDGLRLMSRVSVPQMMQRDLFKKRIERNQEIGLHELVYPILQGWDSVVLKSDVTVIGSDQMFNELQARWLQEQEAQKPQELILMPLLTGTDGKAKMSQSLNNSINFSDSPENMFGKVMSLGDHQIISYFTLVTRVPLKEIEHIESTFISGGAAYRNAKVRLATEIVTIYHGKAAATKAAAAFQHQFKDGALPAEMPSVTVKAKSLSLVDLLVETKLAISNSEARRLIGQGGAKIDQKTASDGVVTVKSGMVLQVGKRRFVRLK